jgi:hypothetical protein
LSAMEECPKCHKPAWRPGKVKREGKGGTYEYLRYQHPRKWGKSRVCYVLIRKVEN